MNTLNLKSLRSLILQIPHSPHIQHIPQIAAVFFSALLPSLTLILILSATTAAYAAADYKIATASEKGTYFAIGNDLAKYVAPAADLKDRKSVV